MSEIKLLTNDVPFSILQGDALALLREIPDDSIDALITDPPYSSGGAFRGDRSTAPSTKYVQTGTETKRPEFSGDNRDQRSFLFWMTLWLSEAHRALKPGAPIVLFSDWRQIPIITDALQAGGFVWRGVAVWDKTEGVRPAKGRFASQCEYLAWGSKGPMPLDRGVGCLPGVFRFVVRQADKFHMTGKPTPLMREVVKICPPNGIILDPFAGSFTTGVASILEGYRCLGFELEASYLKIGVARALDAIAVKAQDKGALVQFIKEEEGSQPSLFIGGAK